MWVWIDGGNSVGLFLIYASPLVALQSLCTFFWASAGACAESAWVLAEFQFVLSVLVICFTESPIWEIKSVMAFEIFPNAIDNFSPDDNLTRVDDSV